MTTEEYLKNPNICLYCNNKILPKDGENIAYVRIKKFCCCSCSVSYNNQKRKKIELTCISCGKTVNNRRAKYCSTKCQMQYQYDDYIAKWKKGEVSGLTGKYQISDYIRRYLYEKYDSKCCKCGWNKVNKYTNRIPLEVEHIDGDYTNNKEENLELLCPNCHSLTSTYKGANRGNGRKSRKDYY